MSEREYDLVVVGAGPAGSSAAYMAAKNGIKVALLEKEESIAQTVRTSGVTWIDYARNLAYRKTATIQSGHTTFVHQKIMFQSVMSKQRLRYWTYERHTGFWQTRQKRTEQRFSSTQT